MEVVKNIRANLKTSCSYLLTIILRILSTSFNENESTAYKYYSYFVFFVIAMYPVSNALNLITNIDDFDMIAKYLFHVVGGIAGIGKIYVFRVYRKTAIKVVAKVIYLQNKYNVEEWSQNIIYNTNRVIISFITGLWGFCVAIFFLTYFMRIFLKDPNQRVLPFSEIVYLDKTRSPSFEIAWLIQCTFIFFAAPGFITSTVAIAGLTADLVVQLKLLQMRIRATVQNAREMNDNLIKEAGNENSWFYLQQAIKTIVTQHIELIELINNLEKFANPILLLDVLSNLVMIAFCVYYYTLVPLNDPRSYQIAFQVTAVVISLFVICFWGTQLSLQSQALGTACYTSDFLGSDLRFQRALQMIIMRSDRPLYLTVGKFAILSINVYATIMKNSYTVFMVLRKSKELEK